MTGIDRTNVILVSALALLLSGCSGLQFLLANAPARFDRIGRHLDLPYGKDPRQRLDIYTPRQGSDRPVVIFWHGGAWIEGNRSQYAFVGATLAERGFVAVLPDYRLYPQVHFPAFDEDGAHAVAWVEQHVQDFGGDPSRIVLMGHSAGGHTAAFLGYNHEFLRKYGADPRDVVGVVGLSGAYVLVPDTDTLRAAFPPPYTEKDWQPIRFVDAHSPPTLLLHGLDDRRVSPQQATELRDALKANQVPVELHLYRFRGHGATVAPFAVLGRWESPSLGETMSFLERVTRSQSLTAGPGAAVIRQVPTSIPAHGSNAALTYLRTGRLRL